MRKFEELFINSLKGPLADLLDLRSEAITSFYMDQNPIQDSFRYRTKYIGLKVAGLLLDEKGELIGERVSEILRMIGKGCYVLGPGREGDALIYDHLRNCLGELGENKEIWLAIRKFSPPLCHRKADEVIRETLWPEPIRTLQTVHVRKAVMAAWLTLLRQTTGSCFATAPAILIQKSDPIQFFKDMYDLLSTGQMKRSVSGRLYSVPLSLSTGMGDLHKPGVFSPGVAMALESVGIDLSRETQEKIRDFGPQTVENLFRLILMDDSGLTEEDIRDEEHLARIQMTPLLAKQSAVYYQRPSERAQKVAEMKKRLVKASTTFKAFTECALLRSWEYSIASLSDVKIEFARWNLYIGLGLHPDQKGGIGDYLYGQVNALLQNCNGEIERLSKEYEREVAAMDALDVMIRTSASDSRRNQLKAELMSHNLAANSIIQMRNELIAKADCLVGFFSSLIEQYDAKLQESFQELFDPNLIGEEGHIYDDSSAGFRLVYKHGRLDASQWTPIYSGEEYIDSLRDFFSNVENDIAANPLLGADIVSQITTGLIQFIRLPQFLASAIARAQEKGRRSPWDYISGGTLQHLLMAYCNRDKPFTELTVVPRSEGELLQFLATIKTESPLLMHSPTHAFIFYPGRLVPQGANKKELKWSEAMQEHIAHRVSDRLPEEERALFIHLFRQKISAETYPLFRKNLIDSLGGRIGQKEAIVDSVLYENSPLMAQGQAKDAVNHILRSMGRSETVGALDGAYYGPFDLFQLTKMALLQSFKNVFQPLDWDEKIIDTMRRLNLAPKPQLFADTNWSGWFFGFATNPASGALELWRLNRTGTQGFPMTEWKQWTSLQNSSAWTVLADPRQYAF